MPTSRAPAFAPALSALSLSIAATLAIAACTTPTGSPQASARASAATSTGSPSAPDAAAYQRAFSLDDMKLRTLIRNATAVPNWLEDGEAFWFLRQVEGGFEYVRVTSATGAQQPLFDHAALDRAVEAVLDKAPGDTGLSLRVTSYDATSGTVTGTVGTERLSCSLQGPSCEKWEVPATDPGALVSPSRQHAAFMRDHNLWLRDMGTGEERALTTDGAEYHAWGKTPDTSLAAIPERRDNLVKAPYATFWSPDSRFLVTTRADERDLGIYPFVEWAPLDGSVRPKLYPLHIPLMGDAQTPFETCVFDAAAGTRHCIDAGEGFEADPGGVVGWSEDGNRLYLLAQSLGASGVKLLEYSNGQARVAFEESSDSVVRLNQAMYNEPNVRLLKDGAEALWFSERSGWGHLYRIDLRTGKVLNTLTSGDWTVHDILRVEEESGRVFFTAGGREGGDPYQRRLYRVNLDGTDLRLLTPEVADHELAGIPSFMIRMVFNSPIPPSRIAPNGKYVVHEYSTLQNPPVSVLRSTADGRVIAEIQKADISALQAVGFRSPERFSAIAADGKTPIWGAMYFPPDFDPSKRYPVLNALYAGPQVTVSPVAYAQAFSGLGQFNRAAIASLGFIVVTVDGRGTPYRSLEFQKVSRGTGHGTETLKDHRAALEQLAADRPYMDLGRVGVWGHSWGGYHAARAILQHNDFYDAAVSSAGLHGYQWSYPGFESFIGRPVYSDGSSIRPDPGAVPENFAAIDNTHLASQLEQGHLLIAYGDLDENVQPSQAVQLMDALIKANRNFDVLYLPNRTHYYVPEPYFQRRLWDYMVEHVMGVEPPGPPASEAAPAK